MFAVFSSGGKQHRVTEGEVVKIEMLKAEPGEEVVFDQVLMVADGDDVSVGAPYVEGGKVTAEVLRHDRHKKDPRAQVQAPQGLPATAGPQAVFYRTEDHGNQRLIRA